MKASAIPRNLRTIRPLRLRQLAAQLRYRLGAASEPARLAGAAPSLRSLSACRDFLPAPEHARWEGDTLELLNRRVRFEGGFDWEHAGEGPLWAFHLHQFDYARAPDASPRARAALMLDWIERHTHGVGWKPHPISLRALSWGKLLLTPRALELSAEESKCVRASLADQIETLDRNLEVHLQANHLLSNLLGVVFGGLLFDGEDAQRWLRRVDWLKQELDDQVLSDGAHVERSPMYHALILENTLDLLNLAVAAGDAAPPGLVRHLRDCSARMLGALRVWTHPDGAIALFGDSALGIAHTPPELEAHARALGVEARMPARAGVLDAGGYVRLESSPLSLIASVAGPMPAHQPGHAHCDALSFELSVGNERVVTDTGVCEYVPGALRDAARATRSHATLEVAGRDQAELWSAHRVGGRPRVVLEAAHPGRSFEATCRGWSTQDTLHRRAVKLEQGVVEICDSLEGRMQACRSRLPLAPALEPQLEDASGSPYARIQLADGRRLRIELPAEFRWSVERSPYFPVFGSQQERACLVGDAVGPLVARYRIALEQV